MLHKLKDVFASFQRHDVKYVVIGGIAAVLHGVPRATFDMDILIERSQDNAQRLLKALEDAGFATSLLTSSKEIVENEITIFKDRARIDVQTSTPGLDFQSAWEHREIMEYQGQVFYVLRLEDLIASKRASGRPVDMEDVRILERGENHRE